MSFITFINSHRIHSACDMLIKENRNILSIGFAVGFNSKSAFNRVFKQLIGTSPGNFRKNRTKYNEAILKLKEKLRPNL